jgi:hypothetical protein
MDGDGDPSPMADEQAHPDPVPAEAAAAAESSSSPYDHTQEVHQVLSHLLHLSASRRFPPDLRRDLDGYVVVMELNVQNGGGFGFSGVPASEDAIALLPETTVRGVGEVTEGKECAVCLEAHEAGDTVRTLPCSHGFHEQCIFRWLRVSRLCPLCRFALPAASEETDSFADEDEDDDDDAEEDDADGSHDDDDVDVA